MFKIYDVETAKKTILRRRLGRTTEYPAAVLKSTEKYFGPGVTPPQAVEIILDSVRLEGDKALYKWSALLDGNRPDSFRIPETELAVSFNALPTSLVEALKTAQERIRAFHEFQPMPDWKTEAMGGMLGQRVTPLEIVGVYVPGGTAALPSSLLMSVIPAQVAGVGQIIVCTPSPPHITILAAAHLCGIEPVYQIGGPQAIAAMAYGTQSIPKVDKIVGAGNLFVTLAKQQVYGVVGLDGLAGPTETMVIADSTANPAWVAADLLAQAEHDVLASAILLTPDEGLAQAVQVEIARQLEALSRAEVIIHSIEHQGGIVLVPDLESAADLANQYAPEHLCLSVAQPFQLAQKTKNAGGLFLGEHSFEVLGDYTAGPSHIMPTGGTARFASPLNVLDFVKISSIIGLDPQISRKLSALSAEIAKAESLTAHESAARKREVPGDD